MRLCVGFGTHHIKTPPPMKRKKQPRTRDPNFDDDHCKRLKDYELRACTWNVRTLNWEGASVQLVDVLVRVKADITAIQEMRWTGQVRKKVGPCDINYSGHIKERKFGVGFVVGERLRRRVLAFTPVDERLATIRIKARFFNISLICAHAPTEEKDEVIKDTFYERRERTYERCRRHDVKIVLGDFNARVGKEGVFGTTVGKFSLHDETSPNGLRLIDFAGARNMVICSTRFQHKKIHQATWLSPDRITRNQIDHVVIDGRHVSSVFDVRTLRGPNIDSDHYLVAAKIRTRLCVEKRTRQQTQGWFDIEKLQSQPTAERFSTRLALLLSESTHQHLGIRELWDGISNS
ncbi:craniofacial development protein 2-like [Zeugodacus cucurbitae]|uniref:craniofacial development protein 2-like n=1 Tax=Zeugodacus cucurbitae TaxID=28588 RepID=UPI0023D8FC33|nr:craniofacial development protein 2-like [Zeugodacus cucurbitae]XP_054085590.1 craniofacial development protein 2-like [Zeugodacus cucurbitae]XP_054085591.1 craniofacial development protein 2-like [Zeugodacus cucurbitae]